MSKNQYNLMSKKDLEKNLYIRCEYEEFYSETKKQYGIKVYCNQQLIEKIKNKNIEGFYLNKIEKELLLEINSHYIPIKNLDSLFIENISINKKLAILFIDKKDNFLKAFTIEVL